MENVIARHITKTPGVCGGRSCIAGHRIRVQDIVVLHEMHGMAPKEILEQYPSITLADVYAALAYYHDHQEEIQEEFHKAEQWAERIRAEIPSKIPPEIREKFLG